MVKHYQPRQAAKLKRAAIRMLSWWGFTENKDISLDRIYAILHNNNLFKKSYFKCDIINKKDVVMRFATDIKTTQEYRDLFLPKKKKAPKRKPKGKASDNKFYSSWEWKKVRLNTIKKYGPKCMCCNSVDRIVVDHIKPRSKFPELELDENNMQVLCNDCNMGKSNDDFTDFRPS